MAISLRKTIPTTSPFYTGGGDQTITLAGAGGLTLHTNKKLTTTSIPQGKNKQISTDSDLFTNQILDLKKGTDEITIKGWLEDDISETAWSKYWKIRAMCSRGGALTSLTIDNIIFDNTTVQAFLEDITGEVPSNDTGDLSQIKGQEIGRLEISLHFVIGTPRYNV